MSHFPWVMYLCMFVSNQFSHLPGLLVIPWSNWVVQWVAVLKKHGSKPTVGPTWITWVCGDVYIRATRQRTSFPPTWVTVDARLGRYCCLKQLFDADLARATRSVLVFNEHFWRQLVQLSMCHWKWAAIEWRKRSLKFLWCRVESTPRHKGFSRRDASAGCATNTLCRFSVSCFHANALVSCATNARAALQWTSRQLGPLGVQQAKEQSSTFAATLLVSMASHADYSAVPLHGAASPERREEPSCRITCFTFPSTATPCILGAIVGKGKHGFRCSTHLVHNSFWRRH